MSWSLCQESHIALVFNLNNKSHVHYPPAGYERMLRTWVSRKARSVSNLSPRCLPFLSQLDQDRKNIEPQAINHLTQSKAIIRIHANFLYIKMMALNA